MATLQSATNPSVSPVRIYVDQNCSPALATLLQQRGYRATHAAHEGLSRARDNDQLLFAARQSAVLITRDREDFRTLHYAWLSWGREWNVAPRPTHSGIVIIPAHWTVLQTAVEVDRLVRSGAVLVNTLFMWEDQLAPDWFRQPDPL